MPVCQILLILVCICVWLWIQVAAEAWQPFSCQFPVEQYGRPVHLTVSAHQ